MHYQKYSLLLLRLTLAGLFMAHGISRISHHAVSDFGGFLDSKGFPFGIVIAWGITLFELAGGTLLIAGKWVRPIALIFVAHQLMAISLVHLKNGWFVVGGGTGGMEYSVLLIAGMLVVAAKGE